MQNKYKILLTLALISTTLYLGAAYFFSEKIIRFRTRSFTAVQSRSPFKQPAEAGLPQPEEVRIPIDVGHLSAWLFRQPGSGDCGVVLQHGHASNRVSMLKYTPLFWRRKCHLLLPDARYHGESSGEFGTYGYHEKFDLQKALRWFAKRVDLPVSRIGLFGCSMGAAIVLETAALERDLAFVIADSPYRDLTSILNFQSEKIYGKGLQVLFPPALLFAAWRADFAPEEVSPFAAAGRVDAPILIIHARDDTTVPYQHSEQVFSNIRHVRKGLHITDWGAAHCRSVTRNRVGYAKIVDGFLGRYFRE